MNDTRLTFRERAQVAARKRWQPHERVHVDLREVDPTVARVIRALIHADLVARADKASPARDGSGAAKRP